MRTPLCVAFARRTLVGVVLVALEASPGWATAASDTSAMLAPVETAQIKLVPSRAVRAETGPSRAAAPPQLLVPPSAEATPPRITGESALDQFVRARLANAPVRKQLRAIQSEPAAVAKSSVAPAPAPQRMAKAVPSSSAQVAAHAPRDSELPKLAKPAAAEPVMSADAASALARVLHTRDNGRTPFIIIDKRQARMWLFDALGQARGNTPVLLGLARGDDTVPGIGDKPLAQIRPGERTTPAGRFVAEPGRNAKGHDIYWVDYDAAVSMHRVHDVDPTDKRLQRLATPSIADNRISYGCINVPATFYDEALVPLVGRARAVVYLLPETRPFESIFNPPSKMAADRPALSAGKGA